MAHFEVVSKYADVTLPIRKTTDSAGYDFYVAEDIEIPSIWQHRTKIQEYDLEGKHKLDGTYTLDAVGAITKLVNAKPTLVPTGIKAKLDEGTYLELSVRSSCPLKYWLVLANGVGIIDRDYYNNPDNEGHIYFQFINFFPYTIKLHKGDCIGQGIIKPYLTTDDDQAAGERTGGFGSTSA